MKAVVDGVVIAEAERDELIPIEGNWYFPLSSVKEGVLVSTATPYTCAWKGAAQYYTVVVDGVEHVDNAWAYPDPLPAAAERAGADFSRHVAFWRDVQVVD